MGHRCRLRLFPSVIEVGSGVWCRPARTASTISRVSSVILSSRLTYDGLMFSASAISSIVAKSPVSSSLRHRKPRARALSRALSDRVLGAGNEFYLLGSRRTFRLLRLRLLKFISLRLLPVFDIVESIGSVRQGQLSVLCGMEPSCCVIILPSVSRLPEAVRRCLFATSPIIS